MDKALEAKSALELLASAWDEVCVEFKNVGVICDQIFGIVEEGKFGLDEHVQWLDEIEVKNRDLHNRYCVFKGSQGSNGTNSTMVLQRLPPPVFDGKCRGYLSWKKHYLRLVVPQRGEDPYMLLSCLCQEVKDKMGNIDDYKLIFKRLEDEFGDIKTIVTSVLSDLDVLTPAKDGDKLGTIKIIDAIERVWLELTSMNYGDQLNHPTNLIKAEVLLPDSLRLLWLEEEKLIADGDLSKHS